MAESVTITTFLELKDNMSAGLGKVEAALKKIGGAQASQTKADKEQAKAQREKVREAEKVAKAQQRATRFEEQAAKRRQREFDAAAKKAQAASDRAWRDIQKKEAAKQAEAKKTKDFIARSILSNQAAHRKAAAQQERIDRNLAKARAREQRQIEQSRFGPKYDPAARAQQQLRAQAEANRRNAAFQKENERFTRAQERAVSQVARAKELAQERARAKAARDEASAKKAFQRWGEQEAKKAERLERQKANAAIREQRRVEAERRRAAKAEQRALQDRADFVGKAGAAMFGKGVGGFLAAGVKSPGAAVGLGAIGLVDTVVSGIGTALSAAFNMTKSFIERVFELNKEYQITIRRVANSLTALNYAPTFDIAKGKAESLFNVLRERAAVLPGETKDYLEVFSMGLPMALAQGERDLDKFADKTSKYAAYALSRGITDVQHIARDYSRILQGRPIYTTRMYSELLPFLKIPAKEFNKLAPVERMERFYKAIELASTGFENMALDADAVLGTMNSMIDMILQKGGKPLFESSIAIIQRINDFLKDNNSVLTRTVELVGTKLGNVLEGAFGKVESIMNSMVDVNSETLKAVGITGWWADTLLEAMNALKGLEQAGAQKRFERELEQMAKQREKDEALRAAPAYVEALKTAPGPRPMPTTSASFGLTAGGVVQAADRSLAYKGTSTLEAISKWALDKKAGAGKLDRESWTLAMKAQGLTDPEILALWQKKEPISMQPTSAAGGGRSPRGAPTGRQTTINDFRFSKFDIRQEFAEGFDPDRIAVAFASDLAKLGEMRMQSAYAPLYAVQGG